MHRALILIILFASSALIEAESCDPPCSKYGACVSEKITKPLNGTATTIKQFKCECSSVYEGKDCSIGYNEDIKWRKVFLAYSILTAVAHLMCGSWGGYEIWVTLRYADQTKWSKWSVVTFTLGGVCFGCFFRVLEFAIDPHGVRKLFSLIAEEILFTIPIVVFMTCAYSFFLYWIELHILTGIQQIQFAQKLRPVLYVLIILDIAVLIPTAIAKAVSKSSIAVWLYNIFFASFLIIFVAVALIYGTKLKNHLKRIYSSTKVSSYGKFLMKMSIFIYIITVAFLFTAISVVSFLFFGNTNKWNYVIFHFLFRAEEIVTIVAFLYFFHKKVPKVSLSTNSKEGSSGKFTNSTSQYYESSASLELTVA